MDISGQFHDPVDFNFVANEMEGTEVGSSSLYPVKWQIPYSSTLPPVLLAELLYKRLWTSHHAYIMYISNLFDVL
jgi:hypothetical protein